MQPTSFRLVVFLLFSISGRSAMARQDKDTMVQLQHDYRHMHEKTAYLAELKTRYDLLYFFLAMLVVAFSTLLFLYIRLKAANQILLKKNNDEVGCFNHQEPVATVSDKAQGQEEQDRFNVLYQAILALVSEYRHFSDPRFNIGDLARLLGTNERYISHAINQHSGMNFNRLINSFRVNEAKRILLDPDRRQLSNEQVAYKVGFGNVNTFYRQFKEMTGFTPLKFKQLIEKENEGNEHIQT